MTLLQVSKYPGLPTLTKVQYIVKNTSLKETDRLAIGDLGISLFFGTELFVRSIAKQP